METGAFNNRFGWLRGRLMLRARGLTANLAEAEDLVQETLLRLWGMRDELSTHPHPEALALTVLRRLHTDLWRRRQLERAALPPGPAFCEDERAIEARSEVELVGWIVDHVLPPLQRQVFRMKEIEGYEAVEIMQITGCTAESLRQNLSRARRRIVQELGMRMRG